MKIYLLLPIAVAGLLSLAGCETDDSPHLETTTTTTEETTVHHPVGTTTETRSVRTY